MRYGSSRANCIDGKLLKEMPFECRNTFIKFKTPMVKCPWPD